MRNIPVFTTEFGVASLILKEIPYSQTAYIKIQSSLDGDALLQECVSFCKAAGAERIFASGHTTLEKYLLHSEIWAMEVAREVLADSPCKMVAVTGETLEQWRELYNARMSAVDNAVYMSEMDAKQMLQRGDGYFVYRDDTPVGIVMASAGKLDAVASLAPGGGRESVLALKNVFTCSTIRLEVASTNHRAIRLYEDLGFTKTEVVSAWYKII